MIFKFSRPDFGRVISLLFAAFLTISAVEVSAMDKKTISVTDVAGRTVEVKKGVKRVILGEGRMMYSVAILDRENPFERIIGWKDDLIKYDPDAFEKYKAKFPGKTENIKNFGSPYSGDFSIESAISLDADLVILNLGNLFKAEETGLIEKLEKVGIPVIFVDFRKRPTQNTVPSLMLMGRVFDKQDEAQKFVDYYIMQMRRVTNIVDNMDNDQRPLVFIENAPGWNPEFCCKTYGGANFGRLVDEAGGVNWGTQKFPGFSGEASFEAVLADNPEIVIGTGANWSVNRPSVTSVLLGYDATDAAVQERLKGLADRKGWSSMDAVTGKRFHSVYHQFYNSPYHFVALQAFAKWFHPEEFSDLDPEETFKELHDQFLPIEASGVFWATLQ
ncbi:MULTISPECIES: ABC transporter substrate-binding protein [unclassified Lentilitoribacter]|jgi:iron complex transport system substrate-binding protein|uniref:ABC transporter substrate-binding protein n=1 Tax=unclassified Lentilitoribacter TaxID=2647570 RepID=UPI001FCE631C|nr:ABC transporter substrate-binding protein [Lentilitoribacter sp. Alg239-R112]